QTPRGNTMDFYNDLSRQLLKNSNNANKLYKKTSDEMDSIEDSNLFYDLAIKATTTQMAYLEHNRANHMIIKNVFESFQ
ncbi:hypothetical protein KIN13_22320, partial [Vibrio cholerae]